MFLKANGISLVTQGAVPYSYDVLFICAFHTYSERHRKENKQCFKDTILSCPGYDTCIKD